jgi:regulator of sigma E protease
VDGCKTTTPVILTVDRGGRPVKLAVSPVYDADAEPIEEGDPKGRFLLGAGFRGGDSVDADFSAPEAAGWAVDRMWLVTSTTASIFARIFQEEQREQLSGVVGVSAVGNEVIDIGAWEALALLALVSLSLAIINLFPFLPLDGGHIFWSLVEKVRGSRVPFSVIERASAVGFLLVLVLFFIGLSNDIDRLTGEGFNVR